MRKLVKSFDDLLSEAGVPYSGQDVMGVMSDTGPLAVAKAMTNAGVIAGTAPASDASSLRLENLDATMTSVLFTEQYFKLFNSIPRVASIQPLYQWNRRLAYGGGRSRAGFAEGGAPKGGVSSWERFTAQVRWMGVRGGITHQMLTTGALGGTQINPVAEENRNRTMELLEKMERQFLFNLASIKDENGLVSNYDGLLQQMGALGKGSGTVQPKNVIDKQGDPLLSEDLEDISTQLYSQAYVPSLDGYVAFNSPFIPGEMAKLRLGTSASPTTTNRIIMSDERGRRFVDGVPLDGYNSQYGYINYEPSLFLHPVKDGRPLLAANPETPIQAADAGAPAAPGAPTMSAGTDATSLIPTSINLYYVAAAFNDSGESLGVVSAALVSSGGSASAITVTIPRVTGATGYRLYRTNGGGAAADINGVNARWIADIPQPNSGDGIYVDFNQIVPGSGMMILLRPDVEDIVMAQMSPLIKYPLAIVSTTIEFLLLLYHTLVVKAPERHIVIKNIGHLSGV